MELSNKDKQKYVETPIAKVRNRMQPMVTYFHLKGMIDRGEVSPEKIEFIEEMIKESYDMVQDGGMDRLLKLIKEDSNWNENVQVKQD